MHHDSAVRRLCALLTLGVLPFIAGSTPSAQDPPAPPRPSFQTPEVPVRTEPPATRFFYPTGPSMYVPLPKGPAVFDTSQHRIRVVTLVNGLSRPFAIAFLPDGCLLVSERTAQLRVIRNGVLDERSIPGVPEVDAGSSQSAMAALLQPNFCANLLVDP